MVSLKQHDPFLRYVLAQPNRRKISAMVWCAVVLTHAVVFAALIYSRPITTLPQLPESLMVEVLDASPTTQIQAQPPLTAPAKTASKPAQLETDTPVLTSHNPAATMALPEPQHAPEFTPPTTPQSVPTPKPTPQIATTTLANNTGNNASVSNAPVSTPPRFDLAYLENPAPKYPAISRRLGEQGLVMLRVLVESNGKPSKIEIQKSSHIARLDQAAQDTVWQWKFIPAKQGNETIAGWAIVPIHFSLDKE